MKKFLLIALVLSAFFIAPAFADTQTLDCNNSEDVAQMTPDQKLQCLFANEVELIENSPHALSSGDEVSLPSGDISEDFLPFFINTALSLAGTLIFVAILYAGYLLVVANDDDESISKGKRILVYCAIGAAVIAGSYAIIYGIANLDLN